MLKFITQAALASLLLALTTVPAAAQSEAGPAPGSSTAAPAGVPAAATSTQAVPQASPADRKRMAAIQQYQHDVVSVVALRADADYLLGAAILAQPFKTSTPGLDFEALSKRAAAAPAAGPAVSWARLGLCTSKEDCPNADAYADLKKHAADNAAVWLLALDLAAGRADAKAEKAALMHAGDAKIYDDYYGKALGGVAKAISSLPPLPDTTDGAHGGQPDNPDGVRLLVAVDAVQAHLRPNLAPVAKLCTDGPDKAIRGACLKLAHTLQWGSSPIGRAVGLHIQSELEPDSAPQNQQASRNLAWQVQAYSRLLQRALTDPAQASRWLANARSGGTELSLILATLRANHVPTEAPADAGTAPAAASSTAN